jgi:hypothetical protein
MDVRQRKRRMRRLRPAKSCGSDVPTLTPSWRRCFASWPATGTRKPGPREEHEGNRKTIARGMPGETGVTVVTILVCFFHSHARLRALSKAPGIPCALRCRREPYKLKIRGDLRLAEARSHAL